MVFLESRLFELLHDNFDVLLGGPHKVEGLQVRHLLAFVGDLLDEVDVVFEELGLRIDDRDDSDGLHIEQNGLHA